MIEDKEIPPTLSDEELIEAYDDALGEWVNAEHPHNLDASLDDIVKAKASAAIARAAILSRFASLREQITVEQATVRAQRDGMAGIRASRDSLVKAADALVLSACAHLHLDLDGPNLLAKKWFGDLDNSITDLRAALSQIHKEGAV